MNYSHHYHAGCFADVIKHWVQTLCLQRLLQKSTPLAIIDTHAGHGCYDLQSEDAKATLEFKQGIAKLFQMTEEGERAHVIVRADLPTSLQTYIQLVLNQNAPGRLRFYPGSAEISVALARSVDNIHLLDAHIDATIALRKCYRDAKHVHIHHADAYQHVLGLLPPLERRGLVIIDPPFESPHEFLQLQRLLEAALTRFAHGSYLIWYPIKRVNEVNLFKQQLRRLTDKPILCIEGWLAKKLPPQGLAATGLVLINPPYGVAEQVNQDLPWLISRFSQDPTAQAIVKLI